MFTVLLQSLHHRGKENIAIRFAYNKACRDKVKQLCDARWSRTHRCWYVPLTKEHYLLLKTVLSPHATLDTTALRQYLEQRKAVQPLMDKEEGHSYKRSSLLQECPLNRDNLASFARFQQLLQLKSYSKNTFRTYCTEFHCLLRLLGSVAVSTLTKEHLQAYLLWLVKKRGYKEAHLHTAINALKFYFEQVEGRAKEFYDIPRPKKPLRLPHILAAEEVVGLVRATDNLKHRALLMTAYGAGLRVSELVALKLRDIDPKRIMILVEQSKGKKDRMVPLSHCCSIPCGSTYGRTSLRCTSLKEKRRGSPTAPAVHRKCSRKLKSEQASTRGEVFTHSGTAMPHTFWKAAPTSATSKAF
jgi:integrase